MSIETRFCTWPRCLCQESCVARLVQRQAELLQEAKKVRAEVVPNRLYGVEINDEGNAV